MFIYLVGDVAVTFFEIKFTTGPIKNRGFAPEPEIPNFVIAATKRVSMSRLPSAPKSSLSATYTFNLKLLVKFTVSPSMIIGSLGFLACVELA